MRELSEAVQARVREELERRPELSSGVLYHLAQRIDPAIAALNLKQFHTRYVVPVKHEQARAQREKARTRPSRRGRPRRQQGAAEPPTHPVRAPASALPEPSHAAAMPSPPAQKRRTPPPQPGAEPPGPPTPSARPPRRAVREQIRAVFVRLARDLTAAESRAEVVQVLAELDRRIDELLATVR